jgi:hypothetical protein
MARAFRVPRIHTQHFQFLATFDEQFAGKRRCDGPEDELGPREKGESIEAIWSGMDWVRNLRIETQRTIEIITNKEGWLRENPFRQSFNAGLYL